MSKDLIDHSCELKVVTLELGQLLSIALNDYRQSISALLPCYQRHVLELSNCFRSVPKMMLIKYRLRRGLVQMVTL